MRITFLSYCAAIILAVALIVSPDIVRAQDPGGKEFGFGIILGDPLGGTIKYWTSPTNAIVAYIGESYFGLRRIDVDYLWHFNAFNTHVVNLYVGVGGAVGLGNGHYGVFYNNDHEKRWYYRSYYKSSVGIGARMIL